VTTPDADLELTVAGRYARGARIAGGGSSTVHRAVEVATGREVALKSFHVHRAFDPALLPALGRAAEIAARLGPDVMPPLLEVGTDDDGAPFVVMPLLDGETLGAVVDREALPARQAAQLGARLLVALDRLHALGHTHGDLSPDNVFATRDGKVLLLDHESVGPIGAPRPARRTEGFGEAGGVRAVEDDLAALVALVRALAGRPDGATRVDADSFARALREGALDEAIARLGLAQAAPVRARSLRIAIVLGAVILTAAVGWALLRP
jgi:serine/threonine protein kinase